MKLTKKILAIAMVLCMVLALAVPVLADDVKYTEEEMKEREELRAEYIAEFRRALRGDEKK